MIAARAQEDACRPTARSAFAVARSFALARSFATGLALVALCAALACHQKAKAPKPECAVREDCPGGLAGGELCLAGKCSGCTRSRDCRLTEACDPVQRRCVLRPCQGDQCQAHADCGFGLFCVQGLCLDPQVPVQSGGATCAVQLCGSARDCNAGQRCNGRTFVCEQDLGCLAGAPCAAGQVCNPGSGLCEAGCSEATREQICGPLVPCLSGRCVQCATDADCGPGLTCDLAAGTCRGSTGCASSRDCAVPTLCDRPTGTCAAARPPCISNESCATDERCESRTGQCLPGACLPDRLEPNDSAATASPIAPGSYPALSLCGSNEDWYALLLRSGDLVQVVSDADPLGSFDLQLFSPAGAMLDEGQVAVLATVGSDGTYLVRARTNDASALYGLRVQVAHGTACPHSPPDPHPQPAQALPLSAGPHYDYAVCPGEESWFFVRTGGGLDVQASLDPLQGGALSLSLVDSDGVRLLAQDQSGGAALHVSAPSSAGGLFYLRVAGQNGNAQNRYDLTVRLLGP